MVLDERQDLLIDKKIVVFSHDVPYDLDATDISKIDIYYALYSKPAPFIEYTARLLFNEAIAEGFPPVSIPGIGYDLIEITSPDPEQIITLATSLEDSELQEGQDIFQVGDLIRIETNMIIDANGHHVPDGTPVEFVLSFQGENISTLELATTTHNGKAKVTTTLDRAGVIIIGAESSSARVSELKQITVQGENPEQTKTVPLPGETSVPNPTETQDVGFVATEEGGINASEGSDQSGKFRTEEFILGILGVFLIAGISYSIASIRLSENASRLRFVFITAIGALIGYNYFALRMPGSDLMINQIGEIASLILAMLGGSIGLVLTMVINRLGWRN
jgi:beta-N-acetylhexosaminidase